MHKWFKLEFRVNRVPMRQTGSVQTRADLWVRLASRMEWKEPGKKEKSKKCARENTGRKEKGLINCHSSAEKCAGAPNLLVSLPLFTSALVLGCSS